MSESVPVIRMRGAGKRFLSPAGEVEVLRGVDFDLAPGDFAMITGPSGSGKSTLLNLASLLDRPSDGRMEFEGQDVSALDEAGLCAIRKRRIGMVFQKFFLLPHRTALDNVLFRLRYVEPVSAAHRAAAGRLLEDMGLGRIGGRSARLLSAGEMQRVAIARAVMLQPAILVADEPTGNLDRASTEVAMDCFRRLNAAGLTILMVTHNDHLLRYASRHLVCSGGRLECN